MTLQAVKINDVSLFTLTAVLLEGFKIYYICFITVMMATFK